MSLRLGGRAFRRQALFRRDGDPEKLPSIGCPTLIVAGSKARPRRLEESAEMQEAIPNSRLEIIEAGRMIPMEAPACRTFGTTPPGPASGQERPTLRKDGAGSGNRTRNKSLEGSCDTFSPCPRER